MAYTDTVETMTKRFLAFFLALLISSGSSAAVTPIDRIIAVVGEDVVMLSELKHQAREIFVRLRRAGTNPMPTQDQILSRAIDKLILDKLQLAEAKRLGIEATPDTVAKAIGRIAEGNNLSVEGLRSALEAEGMPFSRFQRNIRNEIITRRLINREVTNKIQISKSEIDQYLEQQRSTPGERREVNLLHILIATPASPTPDQVLAAQAKAREALARINGGEDFRAVAQDVSNGSRAISGGDLGWLKVAELPGEYGRKVAQMQINEVAGPFRSNAGFHLIKVVGFRNEQADRKIIRQTHARHILVRTNEVTADSDAQSRLAQLRQRALDGDDFGNLARSNSDDQASAIRGGDLDWVSPGNMVPEFEEVMNATPAGGISKPFKSRFGWHIIQVLERRDHDATTDSLRDLARKAIRDRKAKEAKRQYLRRLRDQAFIDLRLQADE